MRKAIRTKKDAFRTWKGDSSDINLRKYQKARNEVKKIVRAAKRSKELDLAKTVIRIVRNFSAFISLARLPVQKVHWM